MRIRFLFIIFVYLLVEGMSFAGLRLLAKVARVTYDPRPAKLSAVQRTELTNFVQRGNGERTSMDPVLGWLPVAPGNSAGIRDDHEYDKTPAPGIVRFSAYGDSFTYGSDVELGENWAKRIPSLAPNVEVLNYGAPAFGLDQAYLRYLRDGAEYHPHAVFIGYMSENLERDVNVFRAFYTNAYRDTIFTKPRFQLKDGRLVLLKNPLSSVDDYAEFLRNDTHVLAELGRNDYHYQVSYGPGPLDFSPTVRLAKIFWARMNSRVLRPVYTRDGMYNTKSEAYQVTARIFDAFYRKVAENGALPIILVFPDLTDQIRSRSGRPRRYAPLLEYFHSQGYRFIDTLTALEASQSRHSVDELTRNWGHYSPLGNDIIARYIVEELRQGDLLDAARLNQAMQAERRRLALTGH